MCNAAESDENKDDNERLVRMILIIGVRITMIIDNKRYYDGYY